MTVITLAELADTAAPDDRNDVIERLVARLSDNDRREFLRGLMERLVAAESGESPDAEHELQRWVGSWILSNVLAGDDTYLQSDAETTALIDAGSCGVVMSGAELRARVSRRR